MQPIFRAAHLVTRMAALLILVATFVSVLFGWALHGFIAALLFSSLFTLAGELRAAALSRQPARAIRPVRLRR